MCRFRLILFIIWCMADATKAVSVAPKRGMQGAWGVSVAPKRGKKTKRGRIVKPAPLGNKATMKRAVYSKTR